MVIMKQGQEEWSKRKRERDKKSKEVKDDENKREESRY